MCRECIIPLMLDLSFALHIALILVVHPQSITALSFILYASATEATPTNGQPMHVGMCKKAHTESSHNIHLCVGTWLGNNALWKHTAVSNALWQCLNLQHSFHWWPAAHIKPSTQQPIISKTNQKAWDETHQLKASACHPWTQSTSKMLKSTPLLFLKWSPFGNHKGQNNV